MDAIDMAALERIEWDARRRRNRLAIGRLLRQRLLRQSFGLSACSSSSRRVPSVSSAGSAPGAAC
jgi:hypothetical protein